MELVFFEETEGIYRLRIPFEKIYTSVFLIKTKALTVLVDCATTSADVDGYIVPALRQMGYELPMIDGIVLTHRHGDHTGGLDRLLTLAPGLEVITDLRAISEDIATYPMAGHTEDSIGVFDRRTNTLISGDGLQGAGVDRYRCSLKSPSAYLETLDRIKNDEKIEHILFSHAYEPWNSDSVRGRESVLDCLKACAMELTRQGERI